MNLFAYCREALRAAAASGIAVALVLAVVLIVLGQFSVRLDIDLALTRSDLPWLLLVPAALVLAAGLSAPLAWLVLRAWAAALRKR